MPAVLASRARAPTSPACRRRGCQGRRRVDRQRAEGVDDARPPLPLGPARRPHRPGGGEARRADRVRRRHARIRRRGPPAAARSPARPSSTRCTSPTPASPTSEMLGQPGDGWRVSLTTLMNERVSIGGAIPHEGFGPDRATSSTAWQKLPDDRTDAATLDEVMKLWIAAEVLRLTNIRATRTARWATRAPRARSARWPRPTSTRTSTPRSST